MLQYLPLNVSGYQAASLPGEVPLEGAGAARLCPALGWGKTSQVPANSVRGRDLRWGESKGLGEAHALLPGSRGEGAGSQVCGPGLECSPQALGSEDYGTWSGSSAHRPPACLCFGMKQRNENLCHLWLPLPPVFGLSCFLFDCFGGGEGAVPGRGATTSGPTLPSRCTGHPPWEAARSHRASP